MHSVLSAHAAEQLLDSHPLATWIVDAKSLLITLVNKKARCGYRSGKGESFLELFADGSGIAFLHQASEGDEGTKINGAYRLIKRLGGIETVQLHYSVIEIEGKRHYQVTAIGVEEKSVLQFDNARYQAYFEESSAGIYCQEMIVPVSVSLDPMKLVEHFKTHAVISECNNALASMYGYESSEAMLGKKADELLDFSDPATTDYLLAFIKNGFRISNAVSHEKDRFGADRYFLNNVLAIVEDGQLRRFWGTQIDVTELKKTEEQNQLLAQLVEETSDVLTVSDMQYRPVTWNKAAEKVYGLKAEEVIGKNLRDFMPIHYNGFNQQQVRDIINTKGEWRGEMTFTRPSDGRHITLLTSFKLLKDGEKVLGILIAGTDISDQKRRESQLRYQANILENVSEVIISVNEDHYIQHWNKVAESYFGIAEKDALNNRISEIIDFTFYGTSQSGIIEELNSKGKWNGELSFNQNGEEFYCNISVNGLYDHTNRKAGFLITGRDITEKKKVEAQLLKSEQFYRTLIADSLDGTILVNANGVITFASPAVKHVLGYNSDEVLNRNIFEFVHPDDLLLAVDSFNREVIENPEIKFLVVRLKRNTGEWVWCMVRGHNLLSNPFVSSIVVYFHDDTLRKRASEALKASEAQFRNLIKDLQIGVLLQDATGNILLANNAMERMFHVEQLALQGKTIWSVFSQVIHEDGTEFKLEERPSYRAIQERAMIKDVVMGVMDPFKSDYTWIMISADPIMDEEGNIDKVVCSFMDITERKKLEQKLLQDQIHHQKQLTQASIDGQEAERREIGKELHDNIGQQLTTIKLFLDMIKSTANDTSLEMVNLAMKGVGDVINEVRNMSKTLVPYTLKDLGLIESVTELIESISQGQRISIGFEYEGFRENKVPENQKLTLFRIIQEQLNNIAKHAKARQVTINLSLQKKTIKLSIIDDGVGFNVKKQKRGLGLSNIINRVELFGGKAEFISTPLKGCQVLISMPLSTTD